MIPAVSGRARALLGARSKARDLRSRRPPRLTVRPSDGRPPVVYYLTPDQRSPRSRASASAGTADVASASKTTRSSGSFAIAASAVSGVTVTTENPCAESARRAVAYG